MGGSSTSQGAVLRGQKDAKSAGFNLHSWQGLTEVLKTGKESLTEPGAYAEFRNLVLQYAQQGGDVELRKKIDAVIATFASKEKRTEPVRVDSVVGATKVGDGVLNTMPHKQPIVQDPVQKNEVPVNLPVTPHEEMPVVQSLPHSTPKQMQSIGTRRRQPEFKQAGTPVVIETAQAKVVPVVEPKSKDSAQDVPVSKSPVVKEQEPVAPPVTPLFTPLFTSQVTPTPSVPPATPVPEVVHATSPQKSVEEYKARISEIKHLVHEHVGNPASLLGTENDLGKKYMSALLSALKATGSGQSAHSEMATLESVVSKLLDHGTGAKVAEDVVRVVMQPVPKTVSVLVSVSEPTTQQPTTQPVSVPTPVLEPVTQPTPTPVSKPVSVPQPVLVSVSEPTMQPVPEPVTQQVSVSAPDVSSPQVKSDPVVATSPEEKKDAVVAHVSPTPILDRLKKEVRYSPQMAPMTDGAPMPEEVRKVEAVPVKSEAVPMAVPEPVVKSVPVSVPEVKTPTAEPPLFKASETPIIPTRPETSNQSELFTPEITTSLHQLLHDWSIFAGSGLFGIGPAGADHPLYKTIAPLSMGEVVGGRWEKADQKIVKTIKQYVDAWRHEQGIAYAINETFEHYLRRVVQRILKRQS